MSVWVMPSVDVYENFLKRSQAVAGGRRRSQAVGTPTKRHTCTKSSYEACPVSGNPSCAADVENPLIKVKGNPEDCINLAESAS